MYLTTINYLLPETHSCTNLSVISLSTSGTTVLFEMKSALPGGSIVRLYMRWHELVGAGGSAGLKGLVMYAPTVTQQVSSSPAAHPDTAP